MLPGVVQIDDLHGSGRMLIGQIPYPDSPVCDDDFYCGPLPTPAPRFGIDAVTKFLGGFDSSHIGCGIRVADRPSVFIQGSLCKHGTEFALSGAGSLSLDSAGPAHGFGGYDGDLDTCLLYTSDAAD